MIFQILKIKGNQVCVGITAQKDLSVHRREIYDRIKAAENTGDHKEAS